MNEKDKDFLLAEYNHLKDEILDMNRLVPLNEKWAVVVSGVSWAWLAINHKDLPLKAVIVWIPFVLVTVLFLRSRAFEKKYDAFNTYLRRVEEKFELEGLGWEKFIHERGRHLFKYYSTFIWSALALGNIGLAILVLCSSNG